MWLLAVCLLLLVEPLAESRSERHHDTERSTDNVSERDRDEILEEQLTDSDFRTT